MIRQILAVLISFVFSSTSFARDLGEVSTAFKFFGPDHKIIVLAFEDPKVTGVSCFLSRAKAGGFSGAIGLAEDTSDASVACRQTGQMSFKEKIGDKEEVFTERTSALFKKMRIVRFYDTQSNSLVYLVYSDKLIDGSPKNSISAVWLDTVHPPK